jgi:hypothetical protein
MATLRELRLLEENDNNKVGTIESILAGVGSGLLAIPKGFFSLGATLLDLGVDQNRAARVEAFFDDLTTLDEKAEATVAGQITEALVNIGIPATAGFRVGSKIAVDAMKAANTGKYFRATNEVKKLSDDVLKLNTRGKTNRFIGGALGGGIGEATFVGDVEQIGTFGDLIGGPTEIDRESDDPLQDLLNRVKFGTEGALFTGVIAGTGKVIKKLTNRNKNITDSNDKIDRFIDKIASGFRARSGKTQEFFDIERTNIGERSADAVAAKNISRELDLSIDKIFPPMRNIFNRTNQKKRDALLKEINDLLLSGDAQIDDLGYAKFGALDQTKKEALLKKLQDLKVDEDTIGTIFGSLTTIRDRWADLFSNLGRTLGKNEIQEFKKLFGNKFKNYIGATYDIFQNKSILPFFAYTPTRQAIDRAKEVFKQSYAEANPGKILEDLEAEKIVANALKDPNLPKGFRLDKPSDVIFKVPDFFVNRTVLDETLTRRTAQPLVSIGEIKSKADREVFEELFGKQRNPMQTIIGATAKLSMLTRRNMFYRDLLKKNDEVAELYRSGQSTTKPFLARSEDEARELFGTDYQLVEVIDPAKRLTIDAGKGVKKEVLDKNNLAMGATNPFGESQFFARPGVAKALKDTGLQQQEPGMIGQLYQSLVLYPKGLSQVAKTILSPVTHMRNFVSASFFATANGIIPDGEAIKQAYQALQTPLKGTRMQNDLYEKLLKLGVVNSNVRLGDLTRLLEDVNFGETMTADKGFRMLLKPLSKLKAVSQDLYTAEDDFWKIASWAMEQKRLEKTLANAGLTRGQTFTRNGREVVFDSDFLEREAADIVKNNIPNYDYVSDFVKGLRKLPVGNFVSFPAEIARTGTNIVRRALQEINEEIILPNGQKIKPFQAIGYTRLFGMGATTLAVPAATAEAFAAIYDVTDEEREALRRYVASWSKNSTLLPIKDEEGNFKYIDFSHANAYDTLVRPIQTVINSVSDGRTDEDGIMDDFIAGMFSSMSEFAQPFISESIWTEAVADILARGGRTRDGFQVFNPQDTSGDKAYKIMAHLVEAQMPFSLNQLKRLDQSIESVDILQKGKFDKFGQAYEFGDEFAGLFGFRSVNVNPERTLKFKVADYQRGVRESRQLFTREALRGGPVQPYEIVNSYLNANRALFGVRKNFKLDLDAARTLGITQSGLRQSTDRLSAVEVGAIDNNIFRPINISPDIQQAFAENAARIGEVNPFISAQAVIANIQQQLSSTSLLESEFPLFENPLLPSAQETPVTPNTLNLPAPDTAILANSGAGSSFNNLSTAQKLAILFGQD